MYRLHELGWHGFQQLCLTVAREVLGQTVTSFLNVNDAGRDGAFEGTWRTPEAGDLCGKFVIQCKYTSRSGYSLRFSDLRDEVRKAGRLVAGGRCDHYVLLTNAGVSGRTEEALNRAFRTVGVKRCLCFGYDWICQTIRENRRLRTLVPRVYGLGDLGQILDERAYDQARALLASLKEDLARVVLTGTYHRAAEALQEHGFVLLLGEPASGKTTIAAMLAMAAIDQWNCSTVKVEEPARLVAHWNPHEPSQFFWIDDAFGVTQYEAPLVYAWNRVLPQVRAAIENGARVVMTSRDYIYSRARKALKESSFPLLRESQVVIDVHDLTLDERRQILYNHLKLGKQPHGFRSRIKPYLERVAQNPRFVPETARRLGSSLFTKELLIDAQHITDFVERQEGFLRDVIIGLDSDSRASLGLVYMAGGCLPSPVRLQESEQDAISRLGSSLGACTSALDALRDSLVRYVVVDAQPMWVFKHPTIADAYAELLLGSPELLAIYVSGAPVDQLLRHVSCGDVGLEGAVVIPPTLFGMVLTRLGSKDWGDWSGRHRVDWFLTHRCSREFLVCFLDRHPATLERVAQPGLYLSAVSEVDLAIRLFELDLLPQEYRTRFATTVIDYAISGEDTYVLRNKRLRSLLRPEENSRLVDGLRTRLIPHLGDVRRHFQYDFISDQDPEDLMEPFLETLDALASEFSSDSEVEAEIEGERERAREWIEEQKSEAPPEERRSRLSAPVAEPAHSSSRSIFDDIDD